MIFLCSKEENLPSQLLTMELATCGVYCLGRRMDESKAQRKLLAGRQVYHHLESVAGVHRSYHVYILQSVAVLEILFNLLNKLG